MMIMLKGGILKLNKGSTAKRNTGIKHVVIIEDNNIFFMFISKKVKKISADMKPGRYKIKTIPRYTGKQSFPWKLLKILNEVPAIIDRLQRIWK